MNWYILFQFTATQDNSLRFGNSFMRILAYSIAIVVVLFMFRTAGLYLYLAPAGASVAIVERTTLTRTDSGEIVGFVDDGVSTWLGIPYAAPPVDRFRAMADSKSLIASNSNPVCNKPLSLNFLTSSSECQPIP